jgi:hypothetical protein
VGGDAAPTERATTDSMVAINATTRAHDAANLTTDPRGFDTKALSLSDPRACCALTTWHSKPALITPLPCTFAFRLLLDPGVWPTDPSG